MNAAQITERYGIRFLALLRQAFEPYFDYDRREEYWQDWQIQRTLLAAS
jgi:hypothetical protein